MTRTNLTSHEYIELRKRLTRQLGQDSAESLTGAVFVALCQGTLSDLTKTESAVLLTVLAMTLGTGRFARELTVSELVKGIEQADGTRVMGVGTSRTQVFAGLSLLKDKGLINSYSFNVREGVANTVQILEVAIDKISPPLAKRARLEGGVGAENGAKKTRTTRPENRTPPSGKPVQSSNTYIERITSLSDVCTVDFQSTTQRSVDALRSGQKGEEADQLQSSSKTAEQALAALNERFSEKKKARVAVASVKPPQSLSRQELQAAIDHAAKAVGLSVRVWVTDKSLGVFRRRITERPVDNLSSYLEYVLSSWSMIAMRNARSARRAPTSRTPMNAAPNFNDLAYRHTYFATIYEGHAASRGVATEDGENSEVAKLKAQLAQAQNNIAVLRRRVLVRPASRELSPAPAPVLRNDTSRTADQDLLSCEELPEWKDADR